MDQLMSRMTQRVSGVLVSLAVAMAASLCASLAQAQTFVQVNSAVPNSATSLNVSYLQAQASGDLNVVIVGWNDTAATVQSVTDSKGNSYVLATRPVKVSGSLTESIYYAKNIAAATAGANAVTVTFSTSALAPDVRILEYSGVDTNNPLDGGTGATGTATTTDSGALTTVNAKDLLLGANIVATSTSAVGSGFTKRIITYPDGDLVEDRVVTATGAYHATAKLASAGPWIMQIVAFKAAGSTPSPTAPGNLTASTVSSSQINLSWVVSTESGGTIASYLIERCQGAGCSNFAQVNTSATAGFNDTGLTASTSYSYRVRAKDSNGNTGPYSNTASATTQVAVIPTPTAPGNLTALAGPSGPIVVATQEYLNATAQTTHTVAAFDSTNGDILVLAASSHAGVTMTPTDNFGNTWLPIAGPTSTTVGADLRTGVWYARNAVVGPGHAITMTLSAAQPLVVSVIVARGSYVTSPIDAVSTVGSDGGTQSLNVASPSITTTVAYDLLVGFAKSGASEVWLPGTGFTAQPGASSNFLFAETGVEATPGPYSATTSIQQNDTWQAAVAAVVPSAAAINPEQVNLNWTASTETGGTVASYLVERCTGAGCSTFAQIGTTAYLWYADTSVTASTSYSYRVRAVDTANNTGPYSNVVSATPPASGGATPSISGILPSSGPVGTSVTISGANFGTTQGTSTVTFGGASATPTSWSATSIVVPVPAGAGTGNVLVTVGGQVSNVVVFTVTVPAPNITSLNPSSGPVGTSVTISGANFGATQGTSTVTFDGVTGTPTSWSATSIVVPVPTGATSGSVVVTVGGQSSNSVVFAVTVPAPSISGLSPSFGPVGTSVTISGANFGATQGTSTVSFNGMAATPTNWNASSIVLRVPSGATTGNVVVTVGGQASSGVAFTVTPTISSLTPNSGPVGTSVTIAGTNFGASQGTTNVTFGGVSVGTANSWSSTSIVVVVPAGATTGPVVVTINGIAFDSASGGPFTVTVPPPPSITALSQASGPAGTPVTISGGNFGATQGTSTVTFNGVSAGTATSWSASSITVNVPQGASTGNVVVTVSGQNSNGLAFSVTPSISSLNPTSGPGNISVTISGNGFGATRGGSTVTFGGIAASPTSWSATSIVVAVPDNGTAGMVPVFVTVGGVASNSVSFTVTPIIDGLGPASAPVGTTVTISGTNFGAAQNSSTVTFGGVAATPTSWSATSVVVPVPAGATTGNVVVTVGGQASNSVVFVVTLPPNVTSLSPASGPVGTSVTIAGANFGAGQGTSTVSFNGLPGAPTSWSPTSIVVPVPNGASTGSVVVTVGGIASNALTFTVSVPAPSVTSLSPSSGPVGTSVTLAGTNFGATQGASSVTFGGVTATPASWSATSIAVTVPTGVAAGLASVFVTVGGVASNAVNFGVAPVIASLSPGSGPIGTNLVINGTNFGATQGFNSITFSGIPVVPTSWSNTAIGISVPSGASTGNVIVNVGTVPSNGVSFTVTPSPTITSISPPQGPVGTVVTINGSNFGATQGSGRVLFNGEPATPTSWSPTSIVTPVPVGASTGYVEIILSGGGYSNYWTFTVAPFPPNITSLTPSSGAVGTSVTIAGANFGATPGTSTVSFNGTAATPTSWSANSIVVAVPTGATTGSVVVTVGGQPSNGVAFSVSSGSTSPTAPGNLTAVASSLAPAVISEQGYINTTFLTAHTTAAFDSTGGDLLVLFTSSHAGVNFTPSDSFGNTWISIAGPTSTGVGFDLESQMWYARNPIVGPNHTVTMGLSAANSLVMSVLVIKGSNKSSPLDTVSAIGSDNGTESLNIASPSITTQAANDLLVGFSKVSNTSTFAPGTGFVQQTMASSPYLDAEAGLASSPAVYSATFSVGLPVTWQAVVAAVSPVPASNPNQVNLSWTASTESGGTISAYLVERCTGSGCSNFTQIGSSPNTTYDDTTVTASTTYSYRVRAQDGTGDLGPYSNTATVTTPTGVPLASITNLSPSSGPIGTSVTISGANFGSTQGSSTVSFNGVLAAPTSWSTSSIVAPVPAGATSGNVTVVVTGQTSNGVPFNVTLPPPAITGLSPAFGPVGTSVTINGTNFGATQGSSTVSFNGTTGTPTSWSANSIVVPVPAGATTGSLTMTVGGQTSNSVLFTVGTTPPPGTITHVQQALNSDVSGRAYTSFTATLPAATTTGNTIVIGLTYGNANTPITATDSFGNTYTQAIATYDAGHNQGCTILYATGIKGNGSDTVTLNFSSQLAYLGMGVHEYSGVASLGALDGAIGTQGNGSSPSSGSLTTKANGDLIFSCVTEDAIGSGINFTPGSGFVKRVDLGASAAYADEDGVQANAGAIPATWTMSPSSQWVTNMVAFKSVNGAAAPSITSLSPTSGGVGTSVTITGTNFAATQGTSTVTFNGTAATPTNWSATSIVVPVPAGATTGNVVVNVSGLASNGVSFTVTP